MNYFLAYMCNVISADSIFCLYELMYCYLLEGNISDQIHCDICVFNIFFVFPLFLLYCLFLLMVFFVKFVVVFSSTLFYSSLLFPSQMIIYIFCCIYKQFLTLHGKICLNFVIFHSSYSDHMKNYSSFYL